MAYTDQLARSPFMKEQTTVADDLTGLGANLGVVP